MGCVINFDPRLFDEGHTTSFSKRLLAGEYVINKHTGIYMDDNNPFKTTMV